MIDFKDIETIKKTTEEFFGKMTITPSFIEANMIADKIEIEENIEENKKSSDVVDLIINFSEPQILIGERGQTLFEIQRLLRTVLNKKIKKPFYLNLDINDYKKKKVEYLKNIAKDLADEVALSKREKEFLPMPPYERRIIHAELSNRKDIGTESRGQGDDRRIVIVPK